MRSSDFGEGESNRRTRKHQRLFHEQLLRQPGLADHGLKSLWFDVIVQRMGRDIHKSYFTIYHAAIAPVAACAMADEFKSVVFNYDYEFPKLALQAGQGISKLP